MSDGDGNVEKSRGVTFSPDVQGGGNGSKDEQHTGVDGQTDGLDEGQRYDEITILHFNDVYNIEPREKSPCGGAARFTQRINEHRKRLAEAGACPPLVLFSGDAFNPSMMSTVLKGEQMVPALNQMGIHTACYGNHDFDFGIEKLEDLAIRCNFPWLISNVKDLDGEPLANGDESRLFTWGGVRIGLIGLIEREWLATLATVNESEVVYEDFVDCAQRLSGELRAAGAEVVIALTHMRVPNDEHLSNAPEAGIDIVLGGHDHDYYVSKSEATGVRLVKSGTDFRDLSVVTMRVGQAGDGKEGGTAVEFDDPVREAIDRDTAEDPVVKSVVDKYQAKVGKKMDMVIGSTSIALDSRFKVIRTQESNVGNLVSDIIRLGCKADVCILNSGTLRADALTDAGELKLKFITSLVPMPDELAVLEMTAAQIIEALENGVSKYPRLEGRFPQVSGVSFSFDPRKPPGSRINHSSVRIAGRRVQSYRVGEGTPTFSVATKAYLVDGKDGYDVFTRCKVLADSEQCPIIPTLVRNHFVVLSALNGFREFRRRRSSTMSQSMTDLRKSAEEAAKAEKKLNFMWDLRSYLGLTTDAERRDRGLSVKLHEKETHGFLGLKVNYVSHPVCEGRIVNVSPDPDAVFNDKPGQHRGERSSKNFFACCFGA